MDKEKEFGPDETEQEKVSSGTKNADGLSAFSDNAASALDDAASKLDESSESIDGDGKADKKSDKTERIKKTLSKKPKEAQTDVRAVMEKTANYNKEDLEKELDNLADIFRNELQKNKDQGDNEQIALDAVELIQQLDDEIGVEKIPEKELCHCCGQRKRDTSVSESYEYCAECREAMKHYPIGFQNFIILIAVVAAAVFAVMSFTENYSGYNTYLKAKDYVNAGKSTTAISYYDKAIDAFGENNTLAKKLYLESAYLVYKTMPEGATSMSDVVSRIETAISKTESKFVIYSGDVEIRNRALLMNKTLSECYSVLNSEDYSSTDDIDDEAYNGIIAKLEELVGQTFSISSIGSSTADITATYDEALIDFTKYMVSYSLEKYDEAYTYLKEMKSASPSYLWLYGYELAVVDVQRGNVDEARELAELLYNNNKENASAYSVYSFVERMAGNFEASLDWAEKGVKAVPGDADLYRMQAIAYIVSSDYTNAAKALKTGITYDEYGVIYETYLVVANETDNDALFKEIKTKITDDLGLKLSDRVQSYLDGKITAKQMFTEGTGDVE